LSIQPSPPTRGAATLHFPAPPASRTSPPEIRRRVAFGNDHLVNGDLQLSSVPAQHAAAAVALVDARTPTGVGDKGHRALTAQSWRPRSCDPAAACRLAEAGGALLSGIPDESLRHRGTVPPAGRLTQIHQLWESLSFTSSSPRLQRKAVAGPADQTGADAVPTSTRPPMRRGSQPSSWAGSRGVARRKG